MDKLGSTRTSGLTVHFAFRIPHLAILLAACVLSCGEAPLRADSSNVGTSGAAFLKIGPGARPAGMGEAFTGVADDIHAIYWNPAGLARLQIPELTGMHMQYFQSIQYEFAAFAYPTESAGTWGFAVSDLHTDNIDRRTADTDAAVGQFGMNDYAYWVSYAYPLTAALSLGMNGKYIRQVLDSTVSNAFATDESLLYQTGWRDVRLGATLQNVGTRVKFVDESDPLPLTGRLGASIPLLSHRLRLSSDIILPRDHQAGLALGAEYTREIARDMLFVVRSGYRSDGDVNGLQGVSAGTGLEVGRFGFDFAWVPFGDLGNAYRYSLHILFGDRGHSDLHNLRDGSQ